MDVRQLSVLSGREPVHALTTRTDQSHTLVAQLSEARPPAVLSTAVHSFVMATAHALQGRLLTCRRVLMMSIGYTANHATMPAMPPLMNCTAALGPVLLLLLLLAMLLSVRQATLLL